ncbi:rhomboid family intramembrane serine protease [Streptococcus agalactiae]|nr:rhomboid family intramembrane serine protease [Streptococcus agalactiae]
MSMKKFAKEYPTTVLLVSLTTLVFLLMQLTYGSQAESSQVIFQFGGIQGDYLKAYPTNLWRLISPIFVHIGWEHFLLNGLALYFVGQMGESIWGSLRFLILYLLSGLMGNIFTLFFTPHVVAAGASTSLFGVFSAIAITGYFGKNPYLKQVGKSYQVMILLNVYFNIFTPGVSLAGHVGGLVGGVLVAIFLTKQNGSLLFKTWQSILALMIFIIVSISLIGLSLV